MKCYFDSDLKEFLNHAEPELSREPAIHSFILSLASKLVKNGLQPSIAVRFGQAAAIQTDPQHALILSKIFPDRAKELARELGERYPSLPGVNGPSPGSDAFAEAWAAIKSSKLKLEVNLRLFQLSRVIAPPPPAGKARIACATDAKVLFKMLREFVEEAVPHDPKKSDQQLAREIALDIECENFFVWENEGKCVCLVGSRRETATERWIAPVYTRPEFRGVGYGSALVAFVSERIAASGKKAMLFTDLENPTSNSIYQKVGYEPVADFKHFSFS